MSATTTKTQDSPANREATGVRWTDWPLRDNRRSGVAAIAGVMLLAVLVGVVTAKWYLGLLAAAVVCVSLWRMFLPTHYQVSADGIRLMVLGRSRLVRWGDVRKIEFLASGMVISPDPWLGALDAVRRVYIPWGDEQEAVTRFVETFAGHRVMGRP